MTETAGPPVDPFVPMSRGARAGILSAFALYLVAVVIMRRYDPQPTEDWILACLALYLGLLVAPLFLLRSSLGWFHPLVFSSVFALIVLLRRVGFYAWGLDWHAAVPASPDELSALIELQLLLFSLALIAHYAGFFWGPRLPVPKLRFGPPRALVPRVLSVWVLGVLAFLAFIGTQGGLEAHIEGWGTGRAEGLAGKHYFIAVANLGIPACLVWFAYRPEAIRSPWFVAAAALAMGLAFLSSGSRSSSFYPLAVGFIAWMLLRRRVPYLRVLAAALVVIYGVTVLGDFRRSTWQGRADWNAATERTMVDTVVEGARGEMVTRATTYDGGLAVLARVPDDVPLLYGDSYLAVFTLAVPQSLWPGKPRMIDGRVGMTFFGMPAGFPPGAVGEAFWNFHVAGVVVVFFLYGVFQQWLARAFRRNAHAPGAVLMYASCLILFREPSGPGFVLWGLLLVPILAILVWVGALRFGSSRVAGAFLRASESP